MKKVFKIFLVCILIVNMVGIAHGAEESVILTGVKAQEVNSPVCDNLKYGFSNLTDGDITTSTIFENLADTQFKLAFDSSVNVNEVNISSTINELWCDAKMADIEFYDAQQKSLGKKTITFSMGLASMTEIYNDVKSIIVTVTQVNRKTNIVSGGFSQIVLKGTQSKDSDMLMTSTLENKLLTRPEVEVLQYSPQLGGYEYSLYEFLLDGNPNTVGGFENLKEAYVVIKFQYPTTVTAVGLESSINGDWATAGDAEILAYTTDVKYRTKLKDPSPISIQKIKFEDRGGYQKIDLDSSKLKNVTHLQIKFTNAHMHTSSVWGGLGTLDIYGGLDKTQPSVDELTKTSIVSNAVLLGKMGLIKSDMTTEFLNQKPTRMDAANLILSLAGLSETAKNYNGVYNFSDCNEASGYINELSYIYAHRDLGILGVGDNLFAPNKEIQAREFYKMLLSLLKYTMNEDYTWEKIDDFIHKLGMGDVLYESNFTNMDLYNAAYEVLTVKTKVENKEFIEILKDRKQLSDEALLLFYDKQDLVTPTVDGEFVQPANADKSGDYIFKHVEGSPVVQDTQFSYNAAFHYPGIYYGTLPKDNPRNQQQDFAQALHKAGAKSLRFPGGMPSHQYLIEGEEYTRKLTRDAKSFTWGMFGGLYNPDEAHNAYYVDFFNFISFCNENQIEPIFQLNTSFFVDPKDNKIKSITRNSPTVNFKGEYLPNYFYGDMYEEAAQALGKHIDELTAKGLKIKYWEVGNEDFDMFNYERTPLSDPNNHATMNYVKVASAYAKVIKEKIPDAVIILTGGFPQLVEKLREYGTLDLMGPISNHYPFGRWSMAGSTDMKNTAKLVGMNEQSFTANAGVDIGKGIYKLDEYPSCTTETSAFKFEGWSSWDVMHTFAMGLNLAHNWGELVFETPWSVATLHDLESPYFGTIPYGVQMDPGNRWMKWTDGADWSVPSLVVHKDDVAEVGKFVNSYFVNPNGKAMEFLSQHVGGTVLRSDRTNMDRLVSIYASETENEIKFTITNRLAEKSPVNIKLSNINIPSQTAYGEMLQSNYLRAMLECEYNYKGDLSVEISGNEGNCDKDAISFIAEPYSITNLTVKKN